MINGKPSWTIKDVMDLAQTRGYAVNDGPFSQTIGSLTCPSDECWRDVFTYSATKCAEQPAPVRMVFGKANVAFFLAQIHWKINVTYPVPGGLSPVSGRSKNRQSQGRYLQDRLGVRVADDGAGR